MYPLDISAIGTLLLIKEIVLFDYANQLRCNNITITISFQYKIPNNLTASFNLHNNEKSSMSTKKNVTIAMTFS